MYTRKYIDKYRVYMDNSISFKSGGDAKRTKQTVTVRVNLSQSKPTNF